MVEFIDRELDEYGVESTCDVLPIAPSTYHRSKYLSRHPHQRFARVQRDEVLAPEISRVYEENKCLWCSQSMETAET